MKRNILIFSDEYPPAGGGAGIIAKRIVKDALYLDYSVTLLTGDETPEEPNIKHIRVHRMSFIWVISYYFKIKSNLNFDNFDVIIINDQVSAYIAGKFFDKKTLNKCKVIVHGKDSCFYFKKTSLKHKIFNYKKNYLSLLMNCDAIISVSRNTKNEYLNSIPYKIKPEIIKKTYWHYAGINKVELKGGAPLPSKFNEQLENNTILVSVSRIIKAKGYMKMLLLFSDLIEKHNNIKWIIVGDGEFKKELMEKIVDLNISEHIIFTGFIERSSLEHVYSIADCFWLLSEAEAFGLVYIEAASFNVPSISSNFGGAAEAVIIGENGYHYSENENLYNLIEKCRILKENRRPKAFSCKFNTVDFTKYVCS